MKPFCRIFSLPVVVVTLWLSPFQLFADEWKFIKEFPDTAESKGNSVHGLAVDPEGKLWVQYWNPMPGDSVTEANGLKTPVRAIYIYDKHGNAVSFSPIKILSGNLVQDTMFSTPVARAITNRGMSVDHQGNILISVFDAVYRLNYKTGEVMKKMKPFPNIALTAPAVDSSGNIVVGTVVPGNPLRLYDKDFNFLLEVTNAANGFSRSMAISADGKDVYYAGYTLHTVLRYHSANGVAGPYVLADSILKGFDCESFARHPKTRYIWASAGSGNDMPNRYPGANTNWMPQTWYAYDPVSKQVVDTIAWTNVRNSFLTRPRAMAFNTAGDTAYIGCFGIVPPVNYDSYSPIQMFIHQGPFEMVPNIVVADTIKFKVVSIGYPDTINVPVKNNGKAVMSVSNITLNNSEFSLVGQTALTINQGDAKMLRIVINPTTTGPKQALMTIYSNAVDSVKQVRLIGSADLPPKISVTPDSLDTEIFEKDSIAKKITIKNSGTGSLQWNIGSTNTSPEIVKAISNIHSLPRTQQKTDADKYHAADASDIHRTEPLHASQQQFFGTGAPGSILIWTSYPNEPYFNGLISSLNAAGYSVTKTTNRPIQVSGSYKAIFISEPDYSLSASEISALKNYVISGGKVIDLSDSYTDYINEFLAEFGVTHAGGSASGAVTSTHSIFRGVGPLTLDGDNWDSQLLVTAPSIPIATCSGQVIASVSSNNGLLVFGEDSHLTDFVSSLSDPDNIQLLKNVIAWISGSVESWITVTPASGTVAPNDSQIVTVGLNASLLSPGDYHDAFEIVHSDPTAAVKKIPVHVHVLPAPYIDVPDTITLEQTTFVGVADTFHIELKNTGSEHLIVFSMTSNNADFKILGNTIFAVPSFTSRKVPVKFLPLSPGKKSAVVTITSNSPDSLTHIVLIGKAEYPPVMTVTPDSITASLNVGDSLSTILSISNAAGLGPLNYKIFVREQFSGMMTKGANNRRTNAINDEQQSQGYWPQTAFPIRSFDRSRQVSTQKNISVTSLRPSTYLPLLIADKIGDGGAADIAEIRASSAGGFLNVGFVFAPGVNLDSAVGGLYVDIDRNPITGVKSSQFYHDLGVEYYVFYYGKYLTSIDSVRIGDTLGIDKFVGFQIFGQEVRFSIPLTILGGDDGSMDIVGIAGTQSMPTDWAPDEGHVTLLPTPLWINVTPDSGLIAAGGNTNATVKINTTTMVGGSYHAVIVVAGNDPLKPFKEIPLSLKLKGIPMLAVKSDTLNFGKTYIGGKSVNIIELTSSGTDIVTGKLIVNTQKFTILDSAFSIPVGMKKQVTVQFMPDAKGKVEANVTITSNADSVPRSIVLLGEGVFPPNIKIDSSGFKFAGGNRDTMKSSFKIYNTGGADLHVKISDEEQTTTQEYLFASYSNIIDKWNLKTKSIVQTFTLPIYLDSYYHDMACSGTELFVANFSTIYVYNSANGSSIRTLSTNISSILGLAYVNEKLYALNYNGNMLFILNPLNGAVEDTLVTTQYLYNAIDGADGRLFATFSNRVIEIDIHNGSVIKSFLLDSMEYYTGVAFTGSRLFVNSRYLFPKILEINPITGARKDSMNLSGTYYYAITGGVPTDAVWLTETPASFTVKEADSAVVNIRVMPGGIAKGTYLASIVITSNDLDSAKLFVPVTLSVLTGVEEDAAIPKEFALFQNYPNPFNPSTTISFDLPRESHILLEVYNVMGQKVMTLADDFRQAGQYKVLWNAAQLASGTYFYRIRAGDFIATKKLLLIK